MTMRKSTKLLLALNRLFRKPVHPLNLADQGVTYAQWQFEKGEETLRYYLQQYTYNNILTDQAVLDIGCGAGGKSLFFAARGAGSVVGVDVVERYEKESMELAREKGLEDKFRFVLADAKYLPFPDKSFDTIIMNDAFEHVDDPGGVLLECMRVLRTGGRIYLNFPPYHHPYGAHLSDAIGMPWVHLFFSEETQIEAYKELVKNESDAENRINLRISKDKNSREYFSYINKMTIKRAKKILADLSITPEYYREIPLRGFLKPLCHIPKIKEAFVKMAVIVIRKEQSPAKPFEEQPEESI